MTDHQSDIIAAADAVSAWFAHEGELAKHIQRRPFSDASEFRKWLSTWMLSRRVKLEPASLTSDLKDFLDCVARPIFLAVKEANEEAFDLVGKLTRLAVERGITEHNELSMFSKYAYSCKPTIYVPYDQRACAALRKVLGHNFKDGDYIAYREAFDEAKRQVVPRLISSGITCESFSVAGKRLDKELFELRATDKRLMLAGGFNPETMIRKSKNLDQDLRSMLR